MWFGNLQIYRLTAPIELSPEQLHEELEQHRFQPCGSHERVSIGWVPPLDNGSEQLTHAAAGYTLVTVRREERLLPASVVREHLQEAIINLEEQEGQPIGRKRRVDLKEDITAKLTPQAFTHSTRISAYIDHKGGWLVVDATTPKRAEELLGLLRGDIGSLPIRPLSVLHSPATTMTRWLSDEIDPAPFEPLDECELREMGDEGSIVRCRRQPLDGEEIASHLEAGKTVTKLALRWAERLNFTLDADLTIKRLRFEDIVNDELEAIDKEDGAALFDARFALMTMELANLIPALLETFGGEQE